MIVMSGRCAFGCPVDAAEQAHHEGADHVPLIFGAAAVVGPRLRRGLPPGIEAADKPGELEGVRVDAGIVYAKNRPYILCVMTTYLKSEGEGERAIEEMSRATYEYFSRLGAGLQYGRQVGR